MVRGIVPRQPAKTGRHEGARRALQKKTLLRPVRSAKTQLPKKPPARKSAKGYNPLAPEREAEILKRLDQVFLDVTCALTRKDAWELLVATLLSAQSTDVNVNRVTPELFRKYPT